MDFPYDLKVSQVLQELSYLDDNKFDLLLNCLNKGFEDEWDCDLEYASKHFGPVEWKLAAKSAMEYAKNIESK